MYDEAEAGFKTETRPRPDGIFAELGEEIVRYAKALEAHAARLQNVLRESELSEDNSEPRLAHSDMEKYVIDISGITDRLERLTQRIDL